MNVEVPGPEGRAQGLGDQPVILDDHHSGGHPSFQSENAGARSRRVAVRVEPPVVSSSLATLLRDRGVDVHQVGADAPTAEFDLVMTSLDLPSDAAVVLHLASRTNGRALGTVWLSTSGPVLVVEGLSAILDFVATWATSRPR